MNDELTRKQRLKNFLQTTYNWNDNYLFITNWIIKNTIKEEIYSDNNNKNFNNRNINTTQLSAKSTPRKESVYYSNNNSASNIKKQKEANPDIFNFQCTSTNVKKSNKNNNLNLLLNAIDSLEESTDEKTPKHTVTEIERHSSSDKKNTEVFIPKFEEIKSIDELRAEKEDEEKDNKIKTSSLRKSCRILDHTPSREKNKKRAHEIKVKENGKILNPDSQHSGIFRGVQKKQKVVDKKSPSPKLQVKCKKNNNISEVTKHMVLPVFIGNDSDMEDFHSDAEIIHIIK